MTAALLARPAAILLWLYVGAFALGLALRPALADWRRERDGWLLTLAGVRLHYRRSYGGIQV